MHHQSGDNGRSEQNRKQRERRRRRRRRRMRDQFENSRRRHDPPPNPEQWEPEPTWKHILKTMWDNPLTLVLLAIMIAVVLYILFPPEWVPELTTLLDLMT